MLDEVVVVAAVGERDVDFLDLLQRLLQCLDGGAPLGIVVVVHLLFDGVERFVPAVDLVAAAPVEQRHNQFDGRAR